MKFSIKALIWIFLNEPGLISSLLTISRCSLLSQIEVFDYVIIGTEIISYEFSLGFTLSVLLKNNARKRHMKQTSDRKE